MSDAYYRSSLPRRHPDAALLGVIVLGLGCAAFGVYSVFRDTCTNSFDRQPEAVINSFTTAVAQGDANTATACWHHLAYLDVASGCSEICLSRLWGTPYQINETHAQPQHRTRRKDAFGGPLRWTYPARMASSTPPRSASWTASTAKCPGVTGRSCAAIFGGPLSDPWCIYIT